MFSPKKVEVMRTFHIIGKRVLTYRENRGNLEYSEINVSIVAMKNYVFLERGRSRLSKNV